MSSSRRPLRAYNYDSELTTFRSCSGSRVSNVRHASISAWIYRRAAGQTADKNTQNNFLAKLQSFEIYSDRLMLEPLLEERNWREELAIGVFVYAASGY